jgi:GNAT superfamily N-acetyltransferase
MTVEIRPAIFTRDAFAALLGEADPDARFLLRLRDEWESGETRFGRPGEFLLGAYRDGRLIGSGGVTHDPYDPETGLGRVRHVFVLRSCRRQGIGRSLMIAIIDRARADFTQLRLRTSNPAAARLYESLRFERREQPNETHRLVFRTLSQIHAERPRRQISSQIRP